MNINRVVITGLGVVAPNGVNIKKFESSIKKGKSGIKYIKELNDLNLNCQIGGIPFINDQESTIPSHLLKRIETSNLIYGLTAGIEAWTDANLICNTSVCWDSGVIMGVQTIDGNFARDTLDKIYSNKLRSLSSRTAAQSITSSISAYLSGYLGLGNCAISNSSACATGTESIYLAFKKIKNKEAKRILAGSSESNSPFIWSTLDKIKVLDSSSNEFPTLSPKPLSKLANGIVPGCGAGAIVLESLESALERGAKIYGEIIGGNSNCGGQRNGGTMTAPNSEGIKRCIKSALNEAHIRGEQIDLISGHLTGTFADVLEVTAWKESLSLPFNKFPYINSLKSMIGHCLAAAGSIETVAAILQLKGDFIHPSINCKEVHPDIKSIIDINTIPQTLIKKKINYIAKASFGFGDINACLILKKYINEQ